ncbi:hypothetical protein ANCCAN_20092 [Ancylostoma caninum]|uniref:Uncharacterized protein n=1 Tax=Ancylostoma caninum TaxID=29170 RepID=A0A368FPB7_ANCCA|nr:hypothetical protein ANCCAN_20092 [Ancylostoma caninum]
MSALDKSPLLSSRPWRTRAATYAFVTPAVWANGGLGNVISFTRRDQEPTKFRAPFEGAPEAVVVTQSVCDFALSHLPEDEMLLARSRPNVSCAIRFSESPASVEARKRLRRLVKSFLPCHPEEGILPLKVSKLWYQDLAWLHDRGNQFDNFCLNPIVAKEKMSHMFNVACSTLAAIKSAADDRRTHWVPSLRAYPIRISLTLTDMPTKAVWTKGCPAEAWIDGAPSASHMQVHFVGENPRGRELHIALMAQSWSHSSVLRAIESNGRRVREQIFVDVCIKLGRVPVTAEPAYEIISRVNIFENIRPGTTADRIVNRVYGLVALGCADEDEEQEDVPREDQISLTIRGRKTALTTDQQAVDKALCDRFRGRLCYEQFAQQENLDLSEQGRDEFMLAEKEVSETLEDVIAIMFSVRPPDVLCITTATSTSWNPMSGVHAHRTPLTSGLGVLSTL